MYSQLDYTFTYRFAVTEISCLYLSQANPDTRLCHLVAHTVQPFGERLTAVLALVAQQFDRRSIVA